MIFFTRELSQKLQEMGCVSQSGFYYPDDAVKRAWGPREGIGPGVPCFGWFDLCGPSERARENARILWGRDQLFIITICPGISKKEDIVRYLTWEFRRHELIESPEDEVEKYILVTLGER